MLSTKRSQLFKKRKLGIFIIILICIVLITLYTVWYPFNKNNPFVIIKRGFEDVMLSTVPDPIKNTWGNCSHAIQIIARENSELPYPDDYQLFKETVLATKDSLEAFNRFIKAPLTLELRDCFRGLHLKTLMLLFVDTQYIPVYINWLSHVVVNLKSITVLKSQVFVALDAHTCKFISKLPINYICIDQNTFIKDIGLTQMKTMNKFNSDVWMPRLVFTWMLGYWGYDVFLIDADAVPINPDFYNYFTSFNEDIVASKGGFPQFIVKEWGMSLCMGSILIKSLRNANGMCSLYKAIKHVISVGDDQITFNYALYSLDMEWENYDGKPKSFRNGTTSIGNVSVIILPETRVCRNACPYAFKNNINNSELLIVHSGVGLYTGHTKEILKQARNPFFPRALDLKRFTLKQYNLWQIKSEVEYNYMKLAVDWKHLDTAIKAITDRDS